MEPSSLHKSTNYSPFKLVFNRKPKQLIDIFFPALNEADLLNETPDVDFNLKEDSYLAETKSSVGSGWIAVGPIDLKLATPY